MAVRPANPDDASAVAEIYNHYIETSHATFELDLIDASDMLDRMNAGWKVGYPFLVYETEGEITGYAHGRQYRPRRAYLHSIEISVYVKPGHEGRSIGTKLYESLFEEIGKGDFHAVIAGISLPNEPSIRLHERFGMTKVAHFVEVGYKFERWIDVGYWQLLLR
jgi:L-amino acid N-acyltransferase YncA